MKQHSLNIQKSFLLASLVGCVVLTMGGAIYGRLTQRWGAPPRMKEAGVQLLTFPEHFGAWEVKSDSPVEESVAKMLDCAAFVNRQYANRETGEVVSLSVFVGPAGPTAVHTPEVCLSSRDYILQAKRRKETLKASDDLDNDFWRVTFDSRRAGGSPLRVFYAWLAKDQWAAPESPRFEYGGEPLLYKIQVASEVGPSLAADAPDPCQQFLQDFLNTGWKPASN